jgi:NAD(P)H dehydrogenase (quinone)
MLEVLVLYYSVHGSVEALARKVALGVESVPGAQARLRTVARVSATTERSEDTIPSSGPPYASHDDLTQCAALALGSPTRFGNMAAAMKYYLDGTAALWLGGALVGKPAGVFTSASSLHGGHESTLLSMQIPLLHHGMLVCGLPYTETALARTSTGGSPYGPTHHSGADRTNELDENESELARALGARLANIALRLA